MKILILCISDSDKHFAQAIWEYKKRLGKQVSIQNIKPVKYWTHQQIIEKETNLLLWKIEALKKKWKKIILLSKEWTSFTSHEYKKMLIWTHDIVCILWGPYWLDEKRLEPYLYKKISFGKHTMPHGLAKLVLIEQVYRSTMMDQWRSYHY